MFRRILFIVLYMMGWVTIFQVYRLFFVIYHYYLSQKVPFSVLLLSFWYGLRMDFSMAAYFTLPICFFTLLGIFLSIFRSSLIYKLYTAVLVLLTCLLAIADVEMFRAWGYRVDITPLKYLQSPREVWASIGHLPILKFLLAFMIVSVITIIFLKRSMNKMVALQQSSKNKLFQAFFVLITIGLMIIPLRGGFQLAPINQSAVYFSKHHFANLVALNGPWNFTHSFLKRKNTKENPYRYMNDAKAKKILDSLYKESGISVQVVDTTQQANIILIVWESFTKKVVEMKINGKEVTPYFNRLKNEGLYFNNAYASGDRTDKGLTAILSGYPALPKFSIISSPVKTINLPSLSKFLASKSYHTSFYYGGETEFANIKSYLLEHQYNRIISKNNFARKDQNSKWGAHDGVVMQRLQKDLGDSPSPFFCTWLTLSSHEPFETPVRPVFEGRDITTKFLNSLHYTDSCVYDFVQYCKQQPWWDHTLLIIAADHGHALPITGSKEDDFKIPILWLGGALIKKNYTEDKVVSQLDLAGTLAQQLGAKKNLFVFSKNSFDNTIQPWAFFSFSDGFGWVQPGKSVLYDHVGKKIIHQNGAISIKEIEAGKAMQQATYDDYIRR